MHERADFSEQIKNPLQAKSDEMEAKSDERNFKIVFRGLGCSLGASCRNPKKGFLWWAIWIAILVILRLQN